MRKQKPSRYYESYYGDGLSINIHEQAFAIGQLLSNVAITLLNIQEWDVRHRKVTKHVGAVCLICMSKTFALVGVVISQPGTGWVAAVISNHHEK